MAVSPKKCPPSPWKKPNEIMQMHRMKVKKRALQARFGKSSAVTKNPFSSGSNNENICKYMDKKRRNPFVRECDAKRQKEEPKSPQPEDTSCDNTLFKLLNMNKQNDVANINLNEIPKELPNFASTLTNLTKTEPELPPIPGYNFIPIDWMLKSKMRIISKHKFKWNGKLKTSEEASGITGFVRCLDTTTSESLDTSMNARSFQCCLVWQHPSLPWVQLFPRCGTKSQGGGPSLVANNQEAIKALHNDWAESFRSLFQLVRARQCPYFYFCANTFTVLFRAAGICGFNETHALLTPTTRGFRQTLKQEDIEYTMPLKKGRRSLDGNNSREDLGYETLDSESSIFSDKKSSPPDPIDSDYEDEEDLGSQDQWLKELGVDAMEIKKIKNTQARKTHAQECAIDNSEQSLICVEGVESQALFNFLMNCKSSVSITGHFAGIPPTLLSPVAFRGATLQSLKVRENKVTVDNEAYSSMEITGPILPHTVHSLAALIASPEDEYSATFANIGNTKAFSKVNIYNKGNKSDEDDSAIVFGQENLTDCGLSSKLIKHFCSRDEEHIQPIESLKFTGSQQLYSWS